MPDGRFKLCVSSMVRIDHFACPCDLIHMSSLQALLTVPKPAAARCRTCRVWGSLWTTGFIETEPGVRELAEEADPFIKKRLLRLASNYDAMTTPYATALFRPT
jgi:hypothetical protein